MSYKTYYYYLWHYVFIAHTKFFAKTPYKYSQSTSGVAPRLSKISQSL
jgi:hypothetical protein